MLTKFQSESELNVSEERAPQAMTSICDELRSRRRTSRCIGRKNLETLTFCNVMAENWRSIKAI